MMTSSVFSFCHTSYILTILEVYYFFAHLHNSLTKVMYSLFWLSDMLQNTNRANHFQGLTVPFHRILIFGLKMVIFDKSGY